MVVLDADAVTSACNAPEAHHGRHGRGDQESDGGGGSGGGRDGDQRSEVILGTEEGGGGADLGPAAGRLAGKEGVVRREVR